MLPGGPIVAEEPGPELDGESGDLGRILTVPNFLSLGRLGLVALFLVLLFDEHQRVAAFVVLSVAGITDFADGYVARRLNQVSTLGKVLDPTADRVVVGTAAIAVVVYGAAPAWLAVVVLGRELLVSGAVLALAAAGARRIDVSFLGKAGTFGLMCCFPLFLLSDSATLFGEVLRDVTWVLLVPSLGLSFAATVGYVPRALGALRERRLGGRALSEQRVQST